MLRFGSRLHRTWRSIPRADLVGRAESTSNPSRRLGAILRWSIRGQQMTVTLCLKNPIGAESITRVALGLIGFDCQP